MHRKHATKAMKRRRRRASLRRLKTAALSLGLMTAWSGAADAATLFTTNGTLTITGLSNAVTLYGRNSTVTLPDPPKKKKSFGAGIGGIAGGNGGGGGGAFGFSSSLSDPDVDDPSDFVPIADETVGYFHAGVTSAGDLVLSFPNGGDGVVGQSWMSLFIPPLGTDQSRRVTEGQVVQALSTPPIFSDGRAPDGSPLDILDLRYDDLLTTAYGQQATLVAFVGPDNTGEVVGSVTTTIVPEPATFAMIASAAGLFFAGVRPRG